MARNQASQMIAEMKEFAAFSAAEQRYIGRSLDVATRGADATNPWSRNLAETASIKAQDRLYRTLLEVIRNSVPDDIGIDATAEIVGPLITISAFDLGESKIERFAAYRFLYERLVGPTVRPWLPSAFVAAAALPYVHPLPPRPPRSDGRTMIPLSFPNGSMRSRSQSRASRREMIASPVCWIRPMIRD